MRAARSPMRVSSARVGARVFAARHPRARRSARRARALYQEELGDVVEDRAGLVRLDELTSDVALAVAFHALTPGRQRSYVIHLSAAKKPETRVARIARLRDKILAGKGAQER
jgi:hypothetical protein